MKVGLGAFQVILPQQTQRLLKDALALVLMLSENFIWRPANRDRNAAREGRHTQRTVI